MSFPRNWVEQQIAEAEADWKQRDPGYFRLWRQLKIEPQEWSQDFYDGGERTWVVAIKGAECLCYNFVECGWGWASFSVWGETQAFHFEQDELIFPIIKLYRWLSSEVDI